MITYGSNIEQCFSDQIPFSVCFVVRVCEGMDPVRRIRAAGFNAIGHINVQITTTMDKKAAQ